MIEFIDPSFQILRLSPADIDLIETVGRTCYKSEERMTDVSAAPFNLGLRKRRHEAMAEFSLIVVRFVTDRGISHELVRHRHCSFAQESTRYVDYNGGAIQFRRPLWASPDILGVWDEDRMFQFLEETEGEDSAEATLLASCFADAAAYHELRAKGRPPEEARDVLGIALKTEINVGGNIRQWRHMCNLRALGTTGRPHPEMVRLMRPLLHVLNDQMPVWFEDLVEADVAAQRLAALGPLTVTEEPQK